MSCGRPAAATERDRGSTVVSPVDGTLQRFCVEVGQSVEADTALAIIEE
jgi:biotin carboxyl carrier protein